MQDKVSIIIPAFNVKAYIERAIESALGQTYENIELVIVDDGSSDGTWDIIERYGSDDRVKCARQANFGVSKARNRALDLATGDHVVFLDSDDWLELDTCEQLIRMQRMHPGMLIAADTYLVTMNGGQENREAQGTDLAPRLLTPDEAIREFGVPNSVHIGWASDKLFSMDVIEREHLRFDEAISHGEDGLFVFDYLKGCEGLYYEPILLWNALERPGSATRSGYTSKMLSALDAVDQMISRAGNSPDAVAHLVAYRAGRALGILRLGMASGDMTEGDRRTLLGALGIDKIDRARLSACDRVRLALYPNAPAPISRAFDSIVAHVKKGWV